MLEDKSIIKVTHESDQPAQASNLSFMGLLKNVQKSNEHAQILAYVSELKEYQYEARKSTINRKPSRDLRKNKRRTFRLRQKKVLDWKKTQLTSRDNLSLVILP